jgi:hypothetical protein
MLPSTSNRSCPYPAKGFETEITVHECQLMARGKDCPEAWAIRDEVRGSIETLDPITHS